MEIGEFVNLLRIMHSIDHHELPTFSAKEWESFRDDPPRFLMRSGFGQAKEVWAAMQRRTTR